MAAGQGTRMRSSLPKPLHPVCGRPMVAWPVLAARAAGAGRVAVIVSPDRDLTPGLPTGTETVVQPEANGTGGAVRAAHDIVRDSDTVVVLSGDVPLISGEVVAALLETHRAADAAATVLSVELEDPGSYGRIVRGDDGDGDVERIVETKHPEGMPAELLAIREINTGTYVFDAPPLVEALDRLAADEATGEYFLPDVLPTFREQGLRVVAHLSSDPNVNLGVNNRADLALVTREAQRQILERHMHAGVTVVDPGATWIEAEVEIAADTTIEPGTYLRGATTIGPDSVVGPHTTLVDSTVGAGCRIVHSHVCEAEVGDEASVGPFAYLRPGAALGTRAKAGTFVEVKGSRIGDGAKVPHLAYVGDAEIGAGANVGAGAITANYDGHAKHPTKIGEGARISVNTSLVAPVNVGDGAYTGAGAVIREDVPEGALGISTNEQRNVEGYAERKAREAEGRGE
ncbi:MAG: UDP-N-acetylglucosamine diphosphorylase/glucosamine-1-phosphate N-acetyltransferase [Solirubrobacterales bacterium]|nr:UDP-N-acetylglucosamine diphosphorylase/glucosamine-1-phosphate N-acetyltransferase [Solirubrobacterales bacterium]